MTTIKDVARRAGVAPSTVSYVLSGSRKISEDTRRTVQQAIDELGYHPRASARTLRSTRTNVLALALPRVAGGYRAVDGRFAIEISDAARAHGYDVLLMTAQEGVPGLRRIARSGQADAAILMAVEMDDPRIAAMLELGFPAALLGRSADDAALPWTDLDWEAAATLAVRELVAAGHRDIAYLATTEREIQARRGYAIRGLAGARRTAPETGADVRLHPSTGDMARLARRIGTLLHGERPPTALVVQHVAALPHILAAVAAEGLRVPEDLAVVAVGNLPDDLGGQDLPRIELPVPEMSAAVTRLAVEAIAARAQGTSPTPPGHLLIPPAFVPGPRITPPGPRGADA
ncbi:LacI family DNA-binding transcriptional regulator [Actinacidiphila glaucinigra]|uniref:LacI family DNA-binding transcriptional regulator n=1 Tax=Actinacidiphila glaucinigra TaxID=235986 RepID=UPI0029B0B011|nr:LacI family DNA-binding transcriptional regulator [Streptomyces sp. PA03-3a]